MNEKLKGCAWGVLGLFVFAIATLFVLGIFSGLLQDKDVRKSPMDTDDPALATVVAMGGVSIPQIELTAVAEFNRRTPTPGPTSMAFWERPGAERTAVASCPEDTTFRRILIPSPTPVHWTPVPHKGDYTEFLRAIRQQEHAYNTRGLTVEEFVMRYPHGLVMCVGPGPSTGFLSNMPGFQMLVITPEPRGVYFSDLVPTVTPTPPPDLDR